MSVEATLLWLLKNLWLILVGVFAYIFKQQNGKIQSQDNKIEGLEKAQRDFITHSDAKQMIREVVEPIKAEQAELKSDVKSVLTIVQQMQRDMAVQAAVYKLQHEYKDDK
jgi:uncharacterized protein HemX